MKEKIKIGHTKKTYGYEGALKVFVEDHFLNDFLEAKMVFLDIAGQQVPYFVERIEDQHQLLIQFEDINSKEEAKALTNKPIYMRPEDLPSAQEGPVSELRMLRQFIGFTIRDAVAGTVGRIEDVIEMPQQYLAVVQYKGREALIPLNDQFITGADPEAGVLEMELPEGLLDVFE